MGTCGSVQLPESVSTMANDLQISPWPRGSRIILSVAPYRTGWETFGSVHMVAGSVNLMADILRIILRRRVWQKIFYAVSWRIATEVSGLVRIQKESVILTAISLRIIPQPTVRPTML